MKNITHIYILLSFFMYIISSAIIYMILKDIINDVINRKVEKLKNTFGKEVLKHLSDLKHNKNISKINIYYMEDKLKQRTYFRAFNNAIIEFNKDENNHKYTKMYMKNYEDIILEKVRKANKRRDNTIKTYQSHLLGEYKIECFEINNFLFGCLNSKSVNLRVSALTSISQIGSVDSLIRALIYISDNEKYVNNKILCDIIDEFGGNKILLDKSLIDTFDLLNDTTKKTIIQHFNNKNIEFIKEKMLEILKDSNYNKEVRIGVIKYFAKVRHVQAKEEIINILKENDWEYRAMCATTLGNYKSDSVKDALLQSISDKNWYVRYNSAISILRFNDDELIKRVLIKNDKYSKDILFYAMYMKDDIVYKSYLESIENLEKKEVGSAC